MSTHPRRRLTNIEFIALRSVARERWGGQHGLNFYWKFNRTWRRADDHEVGEEAWDAIGELEALGFVEEGYCCPKRCRFYLQLTPAGAAFLQRAKTDKTELLAPITTLETSKQSAGFMARLQGYLGLN